MASEFGGNGADEFDMFDGDRPFVVESTPVDLFGSGGPVSRNGVGSTRPTARRGSAERDGESSATARQRDGRTSAERDGGFDAGGELMA